jgi:aminopeptidase N
MSKKVKRLFGQLRPDNYDLKIKPDADKKIFEGHVVITGKKTGPPSQRLTLHLKDLKVHDVSVEHETKKETKSVEIDRVNIHKSLDELRLHSKTVLYPGRYRVSLKFSGKITKHMHGLYPCPFKHMGKDKVLLATQFESHHAREVFPCIDEPEAKATFDLTLVTPNKQKVLANTPIKKQADSSDNGWVETLFEATPVMSTYLLAFVIGEIHSVSTKTKHGVEVSSWATVAQPKSFLKYSVDEAAKVLDFFTDYFKTPFPLNKLDQVALPDFESGAMENWGLITYREVLLLADPDNRSVSSEQRISEVIAHELSHQWFGNLVTMKWWDDLWLNESFATMMAYLALDKLHPDWQVWEDFASSEAISASSRDCYKDVQSVGAGVNHPDEIYTLFDPAIVYAKGGRLLKMLFDYIGEDAFREGLRGYFKKHGYANTERSDLWRALSEFSKVDVNKLMTPWLEKSGFPLLSISAENDSLELAQKRFLLDGEDDQSIWPVPLLSKQRLSPDLLEPRSLKIICPNPRSVVINPNGSGHYIVKYCSKKARQNLLKQIASQKIEAPGRINSINDMLLLAQKSEYSLIDALELVVNCSSEPRDSVWSLLCRTLGFAGMLIEGDEPSEKSLRAVKRRLSDNWFKQLGWDDKESDELNTKLLRHTILSLKISGEDEEVVSEAQRKFAEAKNIEALPAEQRAMIAGAEVKFGNGSSIRQLMKEYSSTSNPDVQHSISAGLCSTKDPKTGKQLIDWGLSAGGTIKDQDVPRWFAYLMRNYHTRDEAWQWLTSEWQRISETFGKSMDHFLVYASSPLSTEKEQERFIKFFEPKQDVVILQRAVKIAVSAVDTRVKWRQREEQKVKEYLNNLP